MAGFLMPILIALAGLCYGFVYIRDDKLYKKPMFFALCLSMAATSLVMIVLYSLTLSATINIEDVGPIVFFFGIFFLNAVMAWFSLKIFTAVRNKKNIFILYSDMDICRIGAFWTSLICLISVLCYLSGIRNC